MNDKNQVPLPAPNFKRKERSMTKVEYQNPDPVVVGLVLPEPNKILIIERAIKPVGGWALPGGYIERGESWQDALAREIWEETRVLVDTEDMQVFDAHSTPNGEVLLLFAIVSRVLEIKEPFEPTEESSERAICTLEPGSIPELCFPLHQRVLDRYLKLHC